MSTATDQRTGTVKIAVSDLTDAHLGTWIRLAGGYADGWGSSPETVGPLDDVLTETNADGTVAAVTLCVGDESRRYPADGPMGGLLDLPITVYDQPCPSCGAPLVRGVIGHQGNSIKPDQVYGIRHLLAPCEGAER